MLKKVAIIGGGLGGLAVAIALHKQGINAQVYEKARFLRSVGAGLSIVPNGLNSLEAIAPGISELLKNAGSQTQMLTLKKSTGEMIAQKSVALMEKYGQPMLQIRWSRLQEILAAALPPETIHLDYRCIGFEQNDKGVEVYFDGRDPVQADLLIGADGLNSAVRQMLIGDGDPRYAGRMSWRAVLKYSHELLPPNEVMSMTAPDGKIFGFFDLGNGYMFWSAASLWQDESIINTGDAKSRVQEKFLNWAEPVPAILEVTDTKDIVERPICDRPPLENWSQGRVTLLGDAAHPMVPLLGQGANTAFEDAWELSQHLCHAPSIETALANYENSRKPRTQIIQIRNAVQANRSYKADSETYLRGMMEKAQISDREFEEWLYNYKPSVAAYT
ncbi:FAD-dependent monooxygenase [Nostocaceae cyanobacterium CENA369]|uniref:FAD-dependent monooxygenase n=1 Tax=Dendronalium phyllosphericum CENA369 TaxID=1725256 RepID=A0A8J7I3E8_9NOST|nr:FAD-dependent monooxygenase [Dendronalium phyllosphericum]MBH8572963.1 FAD-dependent monooxygenase [Dendronalium phyllosphericum CENA369]